MNVAITGAFSYSGKYIARRLIARGDQVRTLTGHPDRPDPFGGRVPAYPLDFANEDELKRSLKGVQTLVNTYWIRFDRGRNRQGAAVRNTVTLIEAAKAAGVERVVHISITNPSRESPLQYFHGKAANESAVLGSGLSYAILRPTVLFGQEDILINNIAYFVRRFPVFLVPGSGLYRLQPVYVDDVAELAANAVHATTNETTDAVGPEVFTFKGLVLAIGTAVGRQPRLISVAPSLALAAARALGLFLGDVVLTSQEVEGLMANLLLSNHAPSCTTRLTAWLTENSRTLGSAYASELERHY